MQILWAGVTWQILKFSTLVDLNTGIAILLGEKQISVGSFGHLLDNGYAPWK
jgi:hypothetical protein